MSVINIIKIKVSIWGKLRVGYIQGYRLIQPGLSKIGRASSTPTTSYIHIEYR